MFGIDFPELLVILVLALVIFGPQKMAEIGEKLGLLVRKFREASTSVQRAMNAPVIPPPPPRDLSTAIGGFCSACGQRLNPDFTFCPACGHRVKDDPYPPPPTPPTSPPPPASPAG